MKNPTAVWDFSCRRKPISRILFRLNGGWQSSICPFDCSQGQASYFSQKSYMKCSSSGLLLRPGKDLAVSLPKLLLGFTLRLLSGCLRLSPRTSLFAPLGLRQTGITRYPSPLRVKLRGVSVRTFLPSTSPR